MRNAFPNNVSTGIKLRKAQLPKIFESGRFIGALLSKLTRPLTNVGVPLAKYLMVPLAAMESISAIDGAIQKALCGLAVVRAEKGITLDISS